MDVEITLCASAGTYLCLSFCHFAEWKLLKCQIWEIWNFLFVENFDLSGRNTRFWPNKLLGTIKFVILQYYVILFVNDYDKFLTKKLSFLSSKENVIEFLRGQLSYYSRCVGWINDIKAKKNQLDQPMLTWNPTFFDESTFTQNPI